MIRILIFLLFPLLSLGQDIILSGYVVDGKTKEPVQGAMIRLYVGAPVGEYRVTTDYEGQYVIKSAIELKDRDYPIVIQKTDFQVIRGIIRLNYGKDPYRNYRIFPSKAQLKQEGPSLLGAPANNLTFLIDVSGSMGDENRLEDLKASLIYLANNYRPEDKISIVAYSSSSKVLLNDGNASDVASIVKRLRASGKSEGYYGLKKAYDLALTNYKNNGNNKIILATDGIFGEDKKSQREIEELIKKGTGQDVSLSIFSFVDDDKISSKLRIWSALGKGNYTNITSVNAAKEQIIKEAQGK